MITINSQQSSSILRLKHSFAKKHSVISGQSVKDTPKIIKLKPKDKNKSINNHSTIIEETGQKNIKIESSDQHILQTNNIDHLDASTVHVFTPSSIKKISLQFSLEGQQSRSKANRSLIELSFFKDCCGQLGQMQMGAKDRQIVRLRPKKPSYSPIDKLLTLTEKRRAKGLKITV